MDQIPTRSTSSRVTSSAPVVVELGCAGGGVISHRCRILQGAAVFQIRRNPGRAEAMVADPGIDAGRSGAALDHGVGIGAGKGEGAERRPFGITGKAGPFDICGQIRFQVMLAGHFVTLAAFLSEPHPQPPAFAVDIFDLHAERGADAGDTVGHEADKRVTARAGRRSNVDPVRRARASAGSSTISIEHGERYFAQGDRVMFSRTSRARVKNGSLGTVTEFSRDAMHVMLDGAERREVSFSLKDYAALDCGYAARAQGPGRHG
jgi:hypothetical protein